MGNVTQAGGMCEFAYPIGPICELVRLVFRLTFGLVQPLGLIFKLPELVCPIVPRFGLTCELVGLLGPVFKLPMFMYSVLIPGFSVCIPLSIFQFRPLRLISIVHSLILHSPACTLLIVFTFQPLRFVSLVYLGLGLPLSASFVLMIGVSSVNCSL
jgi:hypothetical protein